MIRKLQQELSKLEDKRPWLTFQLYWHASYTLTWLAGLNIIAVYGCADCRPTSITDRVIQTKIVFVSCQLFHIEILWSVVQLALLLLSIYHCRKLWMAGLSDRYYRMGLCCPSFYLNHKHFPVWCPTLFLRRNHQQQKKHQLYILWEYRIIETLWRCTFPHNRYCGPISCVSDGV